MIDIISFMWLIYFVSFLCEVLMKFLYFFQPESEVSTTAEDYSSEVRRPLSKYTLSLFVTALTAFTK